MVQATAAFSISRRAILGAVATVPALSIPVVSIDPDAPLFGLEAKINALDDAAMPISETLEAAERTVKRWDKANPKPVMERPLDADDQTDESQINASAARWVAAVTKWGNTRRAMIKASGLKEAKSAYDGHFGKVDELCKQVAEIQAKTLDGLRCKARLAGYSEAVSISLVGDLLDMADSG